MNDVAGRRDKLIGRVVGAAAGRVVDVVDPEVVLDRIDLDALLERIDVNRLLDRVDVSRLLARVDLNQLLNSVDLDLLMRDVDVEALVRRSGIPNVVAQSTSRMAGSTLDLARRQVAGLDFVVARTVGRLLGRDRPQPRTPVRLATPSETPHHGRREITGHYAGAVSRLVAFGLDAFALAGGFTLLLSGADQLARLLLHSSWVRDASGWVAVTGLLARSFTYSFGCLMVAGRTPGKAAVGLRVVRRDGSPLNTRGALIRTVAYPLSFLVSGLGLVPVVLASTHRALHDSLAGTAVVFDFGDRPAELPGPLSSFLDRASGWSEAT